MSEKIEPFEFECEDDKITLSRDDGEHIWYEVTDSAGRKLNRKWEFTITPSAGIRALLAERTRRAGVFAGLMESTKAMRDELASQGYQTVAFDDVMERLQREWNNTPKGAAK